MNSLAYISLLSLEVLAFETAWQPAPLALSSDVKMRY
jgi:hypothetical protein